MSRTPVISSLSLLLLLSACGDDGASAPRDDGGSEPPPTLEAVDVCAMLDPEAVQEVMGTLAGGLRSQPSQGSQLGGCVFETPNSVIMVSVYARPAAEYEGTVAYASELSPAHPVEGVGSEAVFTKSGLYVRYDDAHYFIHVIATRVTESFDVLEDAELAVAIAQLLVH